LSTNDSGDGCSSDDDRSDDWSLNDEDSWSGDLLDSLDLLLSLIFLASDQAFDSSDVLEVRILFSDVLSTDDGSDNAGFGDLSVYDGWSSDPLDVRSLNALDSSKECDSSLLSVDLDSLGESSLNSLQASSGSDSSGHGSSIGVSDGDGSWSSNSSDLSSSVVRDGELWGTDDSDGLTRGGGLDGSASRDSLLSDLLINSLELGS